ncbi:hypothetical protein D3C86_1247440 [compost metagenome]
MKRRVAGARIERLATAQRGGDAVQRRRQVGENFLGPRGRFHHPSATNEQRVIKQHAQSAQGTADGRLPKEKFFADAADIPLMHHRFENHQQVDVGTTQVISVHEIRYPAHGH